MRSPVSPGAAKLLREVNGERLGAGGCKDKDLVSREDPLMEVHRSCKNWSMHVYENLFLCLFAQKGSGLFWSPDATDEIPAPGDYTQSAHWVQMSFSCFFAENCCDVPLRAKLER